MHAITYSTKLTAKMTKVLKYVLLIPIPFMLKTTVYVPDIIPDFDNMLYWGSLYCYCLYSSSLWILYGKGQTKEKKSIYNFIPHVSGDIISSYFKLYNACI